MRNMFFDAGLMPVDRVDVPVISVGNISTGGSGKTPFVAGIAALLKEKGRNPSIVSRGYGRTTKGFQVISNGKQKCTEASSGGDEPALLADRLTGIPIVVDEDRGHGAKMAVTMFHSDVVILDDGFQHRSLHRNCDIVLITARELHHRQWLLPAGYGREPFSSLKRADLLAITKCSSTKDFEVLAPELRERFQVPVIGVRHAAAEIRRGSDARQEEQNTLRGKKAVAFSGIADPDSFERTLGDLGVSVAVHHRFDDHHWFTGNDVDAILKSLKNTQAEILVTTEKDFMRLESTKEEFGDALLTVGVRTEIIAGQEDLVETLQHATERG